MCYHTPFIWPGHRLVGWKIYEQERWWDLVPLYSSGLILTMVNDLTKITVMLPFILGTWRHSIVEIEQGLDRGTGIGRGSIWNLCPVWRYRTGKPVAIRGIHFRSGHRQVTGGH